MRAFSLSLVASLALGLGACAQETSDTKAPTLEETATTESESDSRVVAEGDIAGTTPLEERVATIGLLNKRNNVSQDIEMRPGEVREEGPVILRLATCEQTAPWEMPQETGAFVQLDVLERGADEHTRVFSGWLFKESPSLNVVEHPIYDVWIKDCAMRFPGDASAES